jgi:hypothetical protein
MKHFFTKATALVSTFLLLTFTQANGATTIFSENFGSPSATTLITAFTGWQNSSPITFSGNADIRTSNASSGYTGASGGGNVWLAYNAENKYIQISGINTSGYSDITLSFGLKREQTAATATMLTIQVSQNGTDWTSLSISSGFPESGTAWAYVTCSGTIPATSTLYLKITNNQTATYQFRVDDVKITGTGAAIPTINTSTNSISGLTTIVGEAKSSTFNISGSDLTEDIQVSIPTTGDGTAFGASASSVDKTGPTDVTITFNPSVAGDYSSTITLSSSSVNKEVTLSGKAYAPEASGTWVEDFETGTKTAYAAAVVTCTKLDWNFDNALIGTDASDKKFGAQAARIKDQNGFIAMNADKANGAGVVKVYTSLYGTHIAAAKWILSISTNQGTDWTQVGEEQNTDNTSLAPVTFTINQTGNIRLKITKTNATSSSTLNIDNISITDYSTTGVGSISSDISVVSGKGTILVTLTEAQTIEIINLQGISQTINGKAGANTISLAKGLYIVKIGTATAKAIVK